MSTFDPLRTLAGAVPDIFCDEAVDGDLLSFCAQALAHEPLDQAFGLSGVGYEDEDGDD